MTTFLPVNPALVLESHGRSAEESSPLTPRPNTASTQVQQIMRDDATTPTRANFGTLASQRPLPQASPFSASIPTPSIEDTPNKPLHRGDSQYSAKSKGSDDVEMGDSDGDEGSDDDTSVNGDGTRSKKKGKAQRFFCTEYPPCNLSFTRSEHLARHIRKHTGERPFQCHCARRFSRLDNLRQHAQTVHQNEDIPQDSLAATGTRFQRQVRTDRVRPPGSRSRASTASSQPGQVRGHHRNSLSTSSIGSVSSVYSQRDDIRRRPAPLVMAGDRQRVSQEIYGHPESPTQYQFRPHSPGGFSTPASATYSTGQNSPRWGSAMQSPISSHSRTNSTNIYGHRTPGRRLSVPSAGNPFQSPHGGTYGPPVLGQGSAPNVGSYSPSSSMISSPTTSTSGWSSRRESLSNTDEAWRRRTWHPDSHSALNANFTSRLQQVITPNYYSNGPPPQPSAVLHSNAPPLQSMRLPGIESFDPILRTPVTTPARRVPSPMMIDTPTRVPQHEQYQERPTSQHWDQGINRNMTRLELSQDTPVMESASSWANDTNRAVQARLEQARVQQAVRFEESPHARPQTSGGAYHQHHVSAPPVTPKGAKRMGWYNGPVAAPVQPQAVQRTSPADSSSSEGGVPGTPVSSGVNDYHPGIVHASGWVENRNGNIPQPERSVPSNGCTYPPAEQTASYTYTPNFQQTQTQQPHIPKSNGDMHRLEALVAVATSEENVAAAAY